MSVETKDAIEKIKGCYDALIASFGNPSIQNIALFAGAKQAAITAKARFELSARPINADLTAKAQPAQPTDEDNLIKLAEAEVIVLPSGNKKLGSKEYKGQVSSAVLLAYGKEMMAKVANKGIKVAAPDPAENKQTVIDEADYKKKKDFLQSASEGMRANIQYINVAKAVAEFEAKNKAVPTRREVLENLMPTVELTDEEAAAYLEEAKSRKSANAFRTNFLAGSDDNKKRQLAATAILLGLADKEESQVAAATLIWEFAQKQVAPKSTDSESEGSDDELAKTEAADSESEGSDDELAKTEAANSESEGTDGEGDDEQPADDVEKES